MYDTYLLTYLLVKLMHGSCVEMDYCTAGPCLNGGTCMSIPNVGYECTCLPGYNGTDCELGKVTRSHVVSIKSSANS